MCVCTYIYVYTYTNTYEYVQYIYRYVYIYVYTHIYMYIFKSHLPRTRGTETFFIEQPQCHAHIPVALHFIPVTRVYKIGG